MFVHEAATDGQAYGRNDKPMRQAVYYNVTFRRACVAVVQSESSKCTIF